MLFISFATTGLSDESTRRGRPEYVPGEVLVKFKAGVVRERKNRFHQNIRSYKGERT